MSAIVDPSPTIYGHRVLVIDADPAVQLNIGRALEQHGLEASAAFSVEAAFHHMERYGFPDVAVVDLDQPKRGGWADGTKDTSASHRS